jgi:uncharacterized protein (TIGR03083 family)
VANDAQPWIVVLRRSQDRLAALVQPLGLEQLEGPSMASEWSIAQVLSHLGSQAEIFGLILDAGLEGRPPPGPEDFPPVWDAWNARSATAQATDSLAVNEAFVSRVEGLSPEALDEISLPMFGMQIDARRLLQMRLGEHALHSWDVAASLDPAAQVPSDAVELLIDSLPEMAARAGKAVGGPARVRIVSSEPSRDLLLAVGTEDVQLGPWDQGEADAVVHIPSEALLRLVYGRLDSDHAPPVEIEGDGIDLDRLRQVFPGI